MKSRAEEGRTVPLQSVEPDEIAIARFAMVLLDARVQQFVTFSIVTSSESFFASFVRTFVGLFVAMSSFVTFQVAAVS